MADAVLPVISCWERTLHDLLEHTRKFPKRVRFTFANRIDNLALEVYEALIEARYTRNKVPVLRRANLDIGNRSRG